MVGRRVFFGVNYLGKVGQVTVDYSVISNTATVGNDYTAASDTLVFGNNETTKTITINIIDDSDEEDEESLLVSLTKATGASLTTVNFAAVKIEDNDSLSFVFLPIILKP